MSYPPSAQDPQQPYGGQQDPPYGQHPPAPGQGASGSRISLEEAFKYSWAKFTENLTSFIFGYLAWGVIIGIPLIVFYSAIFLSLISASETNSPNTPMIGFYLITPVFLTVLCVLSALFQSATFNVSLQLTAGKNIGLGNFFSFPEFSRVLGAAVLIGVASVLASLLTFFLGGIGSLGVSFFSQFIILYVVDQRLTVIDAVKAGVNLVKNNIQISLLTLLVVYALATVGAFLCGIGAVVGMPLGMLVTTYVYRRLIGQQPI